MDSVVTSPVVPSSPAGVVFAVFLLLLTYQLTAYVRNVLFHPLRVFPGPVTASISNLPRLATELRGDGVYWTLGLHRKFQSPVVRIAPNALSFSNNEAYKDIYGHRKAGLPPLEKDPKYYRNPSNIKHDITNAPDQEHTRIRRIFAPAFADRALRLQEPLFTKYIDQMVQAIHDGVVQDRQVDMVKMFNFTIFDIMGDLTFGESFGMLDNDSYHPWVAAIMSALKYAVYLHAIRYIPKLESFLFKYCIPPTMRTHMALHRDFSQQRVNRRMEKQEARPDIWGLVLDKDGKSGLTKEEMYQNAYVFMIAGTETTATALSGITYYLLLNPIAMEKLVREIRLRFSSASEISVETLSTLPYFNACLEEGLRMYPPVPTGLSRVTPAGAPTKIDGYEVAPNTQVCVTTLAAHRNPENFRNPYDFVPERWMSEKDAGDVAALYADDKKSGFSPFSTGPRGCLGQSMAYYEMRLVMGKLFYNFDITLCEESFTWVEQKNYIMWQKPPLHCHLTPAKQE